MRDYLNAMAIARLERAYRTPPCPPVEWVSCAYCKGELMADDAYWDDEDNPYCCEECMSNGPYDADKEYWDIVLERAGESLD